MASPTLPEVMRRMIRQPVEVAICGFLIALTAVVVSQVFARYVLQAPLSWSEELARFLLMWLSMLSAAYAFKTGAHFALRILVMQLPKTWRRAVALFVHVVVILFFALLLYYAVVFVAGVSGHRAPALQWPMEIPYSSIVVGTAFILFEVVRSAWREMTGGVAAESDANL